MRCVSAPTLRLHAPLPETCHQVRAVCHHACHSVPGASAAMICVWLCHGGPRAHRQRGGLWLTSRCDGMVPGYMGKRRSRERKKHHDAGEVDGGDAVEDEEERRARQWPEQRHQAGRHQDGRRLRMATCCKLRNPTEISWLLAVCWLTACSVSNVTLIVHVGSAHLRRLGHPRREGSHACMMM